MHITDQDYYIFIGGPSQDEWCVNDPTDGTTYVDRWQHSCQQAAGEFEDTTTASSPTASSLKGCGHKVPPT